MRVQLWDALVTLMLCVIFALTIHRSARSQTTSNAEEERRLLYERAFGHAPPKRKQKLDLPLVIDGRQVGDIPTEMSEDISKLQLPAAALTAALAPLLRPDVLKRINKEKTADGHISLEGLRTAGIDAKVDQTNLALVLTVPAELRKVQTIDLRNPSGPAGFGTVVVPAAISSYINFRGGVDYVHEGAVPGLQPINLALDGAINVDREVLQSAFNYSESGDRRWQRGDTRFVHDDPDDATRYQLGDLLFSTTGFQSFEPLGGISIARDYSALQPYRVVQPSGQQQFILNSPSQVEVFVNGLRSQVLRLSAGQYDMRNFPFSQGANDVQLRITDPVGRVNVIDIPFFFSNDLLSKGVSQFNYSVGVPSTTVDGIRRYPSQFPSFSMFHRLGITDDLTAGANLQGSNVLQMAGTELTTATRFGTIGLNIAGSRVKEFGPGFSARVQYNYADIAGQAYSGRNLTVATTYTSAKFASLGQLSPSNPIKFDLGLRYFQPLELGVTGGVGATYDWRRHSRNTYGVDVTLRRAITSTIDANLDLSRTVDTAGRAENRVLIGFSLQLTSSRQFAQTSYDSHQNTTEVDWHYVPPSDIYHPEASLSATNSDIGRQIDGELGYNTPRLQTTLTHDETIPVNGSGGGLLDRRTSLRLGTAIVFADGHFAPSQPVGDSFAIVVPNPTIAAYKIGVNPVGDQFAAQSDMFGPPVLYNLSPYETRSMQVLVPDLPVGYDVGADVFRLRPTYRSGVLVKIGTDAVVLLDGTLVGKDRKPITLTAGQATQTGVKDAKPLTFFSNRSGRFRIEGMKPGQFDLTFGDYPGVTVRIKIPAGSKGIYKIGTVEVPVEH